MRRRDYSPQSHDWPSAEHNVVAMIKHFQVACGMVTMDLARGLATTDWVNSVGCGLCVYLVIKFVFGSQF